MNALGPLKKLLTGASTASRELTGAIEQLRGKRLALLDEKDRLCTLAHPRDAILAGLDRDLDHLADQARGAVYLPALLRGAPGPNFRTPSANAMIGLLVAANRQAFREQIVAQIDEALVGQETMASADRDAALARLDADLADIERAEEGLIRSAERQGLSVLRREDADPDVLLLADDELI